MFEEQSNKLNGKVPDTDLEGYAVKAVINEIRKDNKRKTFEPKEKAVPFTGFIVGDTGLWDKIGNIIAAAQAYLKKNGVGQAVQDNYVNGDGQILDRREKLFGKANANYLMPLKEKVTDVSRTLHLIAKINGEEKYKYGTLQTNDAPLARGYNKIKFFMPCQSFGLVKENNDYGFKLNSSIAEETTSVFKALKEDMDVEKIFMEVIGPQLTAIEDVEKEYELIKEAWDRHIFVRGTVSWIARDRPTPFGAIKMGIMDENGKEVIVSIPEQVPKDFGELSDVVVIGKPERGDLQVIDDDTGKKSYLKKKGDVYVQAVGIFVVKGTDPEIYSGEQLGESKEIEGWIP